MKIKYITTNKKEKLLTLDKEFPELTKDDFDLELGGLGNFVIAKYTDDGDSYVEITLSPEETTKLFKYLY
jgi:hypothetical protein